MTLRHRWRPWHLSWRDNVSLWLSDFGSDLRVARTLSVAHLGRHRLRFLAHRIVRTSLERACKVVNMLATRLGTCLEQASKRYVGWEHAWNRLGTCLDERVRNRLGTWLGQAWNTLETGLVNAWNKLGTGLERACNIVTSKHGIVTTRSREWTNKNNDYYCR